ncbi:MAG TPA: FAD-dependent oxidoreductase [Acidimicrobiales bacterium]|nr:FAD-dependent oxidoreductase [Acidimicrobiales bacterium]
MPRGTAKADEKHVHDVLVVGGGPAGSSCAYWLADAGWDVAVVEKKRFPREKTCGDGLTPRAVRQLADMGLEDALAGAHRYSGLRAYGFGHAMELQWPEHPVFPSYGYTITRHDLDGLVAERAAKAGATVWQGTEAVQPLLAADGGTPTAGPGRPAGAGQGPRPSEEPGVGPPGGVSGTATGASLPYCLGAVVKEKASGEAREVRARYVVVADGSNSRFGRALGTSREKDYPLGMALRGYYRSPRHDDPFIESHLDVRDADGNVVPGYGWVFPLGDGRVNVGVGLLSTDRRWKGVNTTKLMDAFVAWAPKSWGISPDTACGPPTGGKLPMGLAVGPHAGANVVVAGDAGGSINPFNGEGIAYGYETGRLAAAHLGQALAGDGPAALARYDRHLADAYGPYYRVARAFVHLISHPDVMRVCVGAGMRSEWFMAQLLRIMANLLRPDTLGPAEVAFRLMDGLAGVLPDDALSQLLAG